MKRILTQKNRKFWPVILLTIYFVFNGILLAGHELWRDEANVWLIARDMTPLQLFREIKYQGHPCLWYLIVMPFAKVGFPFKTISVLSFLLMAVTAVLFTYKAPFHPITKAVCLLSPMFSYYYPVVARNYCLIALLLILLAYLYPKRNEKNILYGLLIGLLIQADTIAMAAAGLLSCMWLWECISKSIKEKSKRMLWIGAKGLWIPLVSLLLWGLQFFRVSDSPEYSVRLLSGTELLSEIRNFSYHILTRMTGMGETFDFVFMLLFLMAGFLLTIAVRNMWPFIVMVGSFLFEVVFSILIYQLHIWHYIALCFSLIWCFWVYDSLASNSTIRKYAGMVGKVIAELVIVVLAIFMFIRWNDPEESSGLANAWSGVYSDGVNVADYIENHVDVEDLVIMTDIVEGATVQAYLGRDYGFYFAGNGQKLTYANYTEEQSTPVTYDQMLKWVEGSFPQKEYFYMLISPTNYVTDIPDNDKQKWELCYQTGEETARGEEYSLVKIYIQE